MGGAGALQMAATLLLLLFSVPATPASAASPKNIVHTWKRIYYAELDGKESLVFAGRFDRSKPSLADIDGDGDLDLFLGRGDGRIMFFENKGGKTKPSWRLVNAAVSAFSSRSGRVLQRIDVGENAAPTLVDMDGDGDLDLMVGSASGRVYYYVNEGNRFLATFRLRNSNFLGKPAGLNVVVKFPDLNGDGLPDLSLGNEAGEYFIALNLGSRAEPRYCLQENTSPECLSVLTSLGKLHPEDNAVPEWVDWDQDGDLDLLVGKSDGTLAYLQNIGDARKGIWEAGATRFQVLDVGGFSSPVFADLNGDGVVDLLLAGDSEKIVYYSNRREKKKFPLWLEDKNVLAVRRLGGFQTRIHVTSGDLDADGDIDLLLGTRNGRLLLYINTGGKGKLAFVSPRNPILQTPQRAFSAPSLVDVDGDGDLDLIVGGREGRLEWIENNGTPQKPHWRARSLFFAEVDVGGLSVPHFADLDGDKDPDLLVGNSLGSLIYYENTGNPNRPVYQLRTVRFAGLQARANASPSLFSWRAKGAPDLVVGNQTGTLIPAIRNDAIPLLSRGGYRPQNPWRGLRAGAYSAPHFADFTGDGKADLLVGTGDGSLLFWRYEGSGPPAKITAAPRSNSIEEQLARTESLSPSDLPGGAGSRGRPGSEQGASSGEAAQARENLPLDPIFVYERSSLEKLRPGRGSKPAFFDANGDGRPDLVVGTAAGKLILYEARGNSANPTWSQAKGNFAGYKHGRNAAPVFADVDGDGDLDLAVGNERGRIVYWENTGSARSPRLTLRKNAFSSVRVGNNAVPAFSDLNGDGRADLLVGNLKGRMAYYRQEKKRGKGFPLENRRFIGLDVGINASPAFAPLTGKARQFLLLGSDQGRIHVYAATGTSLERSSGWKENTSYLDGLKLPPGSHPALGDIDGDGDIDLVVGSDKGRLYLYRNHAIGKGEAGRR